MVCVSKLAENEKLNCMHTLRSLITFNSIAILETVVRDGTLSIFTSSIREKPEISRPKIKCICSINITMLQ